MVTDVRADTALAAVTRRACFRVNRLRAAAVGAVAGAVGTAAMDALWYRRYRRGGGTQRPFEWEFSAGTTSWDEVSDPGKVGHLVLRRSTGTEPPDRWARTTQNVVHWATGIAWGAQYGALVAGARRSRPWWGLGLGVAVWATSYAILPLAGIYQPIWTYDADTLGQDLSAHLLYGAAAGATYAAARRTAPCVSSSACSRTCAVE